MSNTKPDTPSTARRVLVVDDNEDAAESLAALLRLFGHEVDVAFDGEQVLALAPEVKPDLVLLDLGMPRMDGHEVARRMRAEPWGGGMKIIALSGFGDVADRARSLEAGCNDHLVKPVSPVELELALAHA
ncbi:MAG: response regulator [Burkholderiaceae bacterium]